jgi:hypothetical protein
MEVLVIKGVHQYVQVQSKERYITMFQSNLILVGPDLSAVITWIGLELSAAGPHVLEFLCSCQLDLARVSELRSIERFRTQNTGHHTIGYEPG